MDILDQLNTRQSSKLKKKTSILTCIQEEPYQVRNHDRGGQHKQNFLPNNNQHTSHQHLRLAHFDLNVGTQRDKKTGSHKDSSSAGDKLSKFGVTPSLAVIVSESSEESKNSSMAVPPRRRSQASESINKAINPIQQEELNQKLRDYETKNNQLTVKVSSLQMLIQEKNQRIRQLQDKIDLLEARNSQDRRLMLQEQAKLVQNNTERLQKVHHQQFQRQSQLLKWEYESKNKVMKEQLQSLRAININYKHLLDSETRIVNQRNRQQVNEQSNMKSKELQRQKHVLKEQQEKITAQQRQFHDKMNGFYKQKQQQSQKIIRIQKQLQQERIKIKKQRMDMLRQIRETQSEKQRQLDAKIQKYEAKARNIEIESLQLQTMREFLEKQKQQLRKISQISMQESKKNTQKIMRQKQRLYKLEKQLIERIQIVEMCAKNGISSKSMQEKQNKTIIEQNINQEIKKEPIEKEKMGIGHGRYEHINISAYLNKLNKAGTVDENKGGRKIYKLQKFYI